MSLVLGRRAALSFAPPSYLAQKAAGVDISTSGVKSAILAEGPHGIELAHFGEERLPSGAFDGEFTDRAAIVQAIVALRKRTHFPIACAALPESKSYLFETTAVGTTKDEWHVAVEQHLDELVPLPPVETVFDIVRVGTGTQGEALIAGVGYARRMVEETLAAFDEADIPVRSLEGETFAMARALLPHGDESTVLIIDIGKTTTKLAIVAKRIPRFTTTFGIGGHALTLAVQKHFGVTEEEARKVKAERGIVPSPGNEDYIGAMLSTVSAIKDEIARRLEYWQTRAPLSGTNERVTRAILAGGNASIRGLPEYLEGALHVPVTTGDVFTNLAPREHWLPPLDYMESLAYATAIGLALRDYVPRTH